MTLKERITEDMKTAMRSGEKDRLAVIRLLQAAIKQREVDERIMLDDAQVTSVLEKMIKQRKESIVAFEKGARADLVAKETAEIAVLSPICPRSSPTPNSTPSLPKPSAAPAPRPSRTWAR